jgi:hypothetical protein
MELKLSEELFKKWSDLMIRKYGYTDHPTRPEVFEFAENLTKYFEILAEDNITSKIKSIN